MISFFFLNSVKGHFPTGGRENAHTFEEARDAMQEKEGTQLSHQYVIHMCLNIFHCLTCCMKLPGQFLTVINNGKNNSMRHRIRYTYILVQPVQ